MSYAIKDGKLIRRERLRKREPVREPIVAPYCKELWHHGPVSKVARMLAKEDYRKELMRKGQDLRQYSEKWIDNQVTVLLFNSGNHYMRRAKEWLR
jgi:hypothetical protein